MVSRFPDYRLQLFGTVSGSIKQKEGPGSTLMNVRNKHNQLSFCLESKLDGYVEDGWISMDFVSRYVIFFYFILFLREQEDEYNEPALSTSG